MALPQSNNARSSPTTMQKVTSKLPSWDTTKTQSKKGFDKVWGWADKLGAPVNRLSNRIGSEAFWPTTLDKESDKAARILRSFCKDGFYTEEETPAPDAAGPKKKQRVLKKIPQRVIQRAVGLAIFTTMRTGLWVSGAGGSGVLIARTEDGSWSPPSGILLHTAGLGFLVGVDIYDCVLVINNRKALDAFTKIRATLGGEISAVAGPVGAGGVLENDGKWKEANRPVFTYLKSRGFYAGVQVDGTIIIERTDENKRFYEEPVRVADILAGKPKRRPPGLKMLTETLKAAEGRTDVDTELLDEVADEPAPGDLNVDAPGAGSEARALMFGVPDPDDPDPYGVLALETQGLEVRDAATRSRPPSQQFEFNPSPTSPVYKAFRSHQYRRSLDPTVPESPRSNRASSVNSPPTRWSLGRPYLQGSPTSSSDVATQTDPVLISPMPAELLLTQDSASTLETPETAQDEEDRSVYEDVADAPGAVHRPDPDLAATTPGGNPWAADEAGGEEEKASKLSSPYGDDAADKLGGEEGGHDDADRIHTPRHTTPVTNGDAETSTPAKGPPPPLPPRNRAPANPEFEDVELKDAEKEP
ncbi:Ysc84 actin-binding domain protein [Niveomyces insectorum RCEF 264]|uniref:Ysc84 actin-binding domain protein n=1 Tax=Niveomyces insectorum RCEF 264 TaxID=1081102 RepID=A0A167SK42_9HYPO|nr:Ysc84 actin-binding domain protein [Niveomyces insectorum RCEF 264]